MIVKDAIWFNDIGIVAVENDVGEIKFYIGKGAGFSESADRLHIANHGSKVYPDYLNMFFERYKKQ